MGLSVAMRAAAAIAVLALASSGLSACARHDDPASDASVLKVASQRGGTRALMEAAGVLQGAPYKIEWSEFPSAQTLLEALGAGATDLGEVGGPPLMFAYADGSKVKAVQGIRYQPMGSSTAILVPENSPIHTAADLKGRRIATGRGSVGHYLLLLALERAHIQPSDVNIVFLAPGDAKAALAAGSVDAWSTWGSYVPLAVQGDHARVIIDNRGLMHDLGFEAASDKAIDEKHAQIDDFLRRMAKAERWGWDHRDLYAQALAKDTGLPLAIAQATLEARGRMSAAPLDADAEADERDTLAHFQAAGLIKTLPDIHAALDPSFNDAANP